jgi:iron complex outermembrane receptor protein
VGIDIEPQSLPGLRFSATWWNTKYQGAITAPQAAFAIGSPDLSSLLQLYPGGVPADVLASATSGLPQTSPLAPISYFIYSFQQRNAFNLEANGIDGDLSYQFRTDIGTFLMGVAVSHKLKMDQQFGTGGETFSVLNTIGINTTFPSNRTAGRLNLGLEPRRPEHRRVRELQRLVPQLERLGAVSRSCATRASRRSAAARGRRTT